MHIGRLMRHAAATHWRTRLKFSERTLDTVEAAIGEAERTHAGEIRFTIETALPLLNVVSGLTPRARALQVFAQLRVWDTEHNNGVLIYVLIADRSVEIVADRGVAGRVPPAEWEAVCRMMEEHFRAGRFEAGAVAGVIAVGALLARHFPAAAARSSSVGNQLPDRPTLL